MSWQCAEVKRKGECVVKCVVEIDTVRARESYAECSLSNFWHLGLFPGFFCFVYAQAIPSALSAATVAHTNSLTCACCTLSSSENCYSNQWSPAPDQVRTFTFERASSLFHPLDPFSFGGTAGPFFPFFHPTRRFSLSVEMCSVTSFPLSLSLPITHFFFFILSTTSVIMCHL